MEGGPQQSPQLSREEQIQSLRNRIRIAEESEDERKVLILEAELKALEAGETFDRIAYEKENAPKPIQKTDVLRHMQTLRTTPGDQWVWDGPYRYSYDHKSYDYCFEEVLRDAGYVNFQELVQTRAEELERPLNVLDLFGGAYFLQNLNQISHIVGVRLENIDTEYEKWQGSVRELIDSPKRKIIEGNLYKGSTWRDIRDEVNRYEHKGFDLITCRPQGPFGHTPGRGIESARDIKQPQDVFFKEEIYLTLLERTLDLLSPQGGLLFLQMPVLYVPPEISNAFWKKYTEEKIREGYEFFFAGDMHNAGERVMVRRDSMNLKRGWVSA